MTMLALAAVAALVVAWAVLVVVAQVLNPDQSPLSMGMSGLARGRAPWVMKSSFIAAACRRCCCCRASRRARRRRSVAAGVLLLWVWGVGSAALALADTDMPGEAATPRRRRARLIALVAYIAGVAGAIVLSLALPRRDPGVGAGRCPSRSRRRSPSWCSSSPSGGRAGGAVRGRRRPGDARRRAACRRASAARSPASRRQAPAPGARRRPPARGTGSPARPRRLRRPLPADLRRAAHGLDAARRAGHPLR